MAARLFLGANALMIGLIGLAYLYNPDLLLSRYGLQAGSAGMDNMLRATYGGLFVAIASLFAWGTVRSERRSDALGLLILFMASQAVGRAASMIFAGSAPEAIMGLFYYECAAVVIGLVLWFRGRN